MNGSSCYVKTAVMSQFLPAYGIDPATHTDGPQCSASHEFCFFCYFESDPATAGTDCDLHGSLKSLVDHLGSADKELPMIVESVHNAYQTTVRPHITWDNPTGVLVHNPVWSKDSIRRHLLYSAEFATLFNSVIRQIFHSIIIKQNESMVDADTGMVVDDHRKAFLQTVTGYRQFLHSTGPNSKEPKRKK